MGFLAHLSGRTLVTCETTALAEALQLAKSARDTAA
jgi:hypothetical protein